MSSQKGNATRSRPQKYQNTHVFKNDMHDKSHKTKLINNITVVNVCERCKKIIEWKIKYKKYKPLKAPAKCVKCEQKVIKHAYHIMCGHCALEHKCCPKCGETGDIVKEEPKDEAPKLDRELRLMLKKLPERKRRTFMRYMNRKTAEKEKSATAEGSKKAEEDKEEEDEEDESESEADTQEKVEPLTREDLLEKLKSLMISCKKDHDDDDFGSDSDDLDDEKDDDED